jgi:hypothetical protein
VLRIRIELPDQPGSLARVTWTLGVLGADIAQITVLERDGGRALDDITLEWRGQPRDRLLSALRSTPGVKPVGVWTTPNSAEALPEIDVVAQLVAKPDRALTTLTDAAPLVLAADWACVTTAAGTVVQATLGTPGAIPLPARIPSRAIAETHEARLLRAPLRGEHLLTVARTGGPPFHRTEVARLQRLLDVIELLPGTTVPAGSPPWR